MMRGQAYVIISIVSIILISLFAVLNLETVQVHYLLWKGESRVIFVILFSVLLGVILTSVVGSVKYFSLKKENKSLIKRLSKYEEVNIKTSTNKKENEVDEE